MKEKRYVQHISGQGQKWEVVCERSDEWAVWMQGKKDMHYIPLSEYRLCEPPEVWEDVTKECRVVPYGDDIAHETDGVIRTERGYRLRKVQLWKQYEGMAEYKDQWAFIVERKEQP